MMDGKLSVFYANVLDAVKESGKTEEEVLSLIKNAGIEALDLDFNVLKNGLPEAIGRAGMKVNSIYAFFDFSKEESFSEAEKVLDTAEHFRAVAMFVPELLREEDAAKLKAAKLKAAKDKKAIFQALDEDPTAVKTAEALETLAVAGEKRGIPVCVENFDSRRSLTERKDELSWLFSKAPHLRFNPDTGNAVTCGENILDLYKEFGEKTVNVHCKDRCPDGSGFPTAVVGEGKMPIAEIKKDLLKNGYAGRFSIEVFGVPDALNAILKSANNLQR